MTYSALSAEMVVTVRVTVEPAPRNFIDDVIYYDIIKIVPECLLLKEHAEDRLCDACWLDEIVRNVGVKDFLLGNDYADPVDSCEIVLYGRITHSQVHDNIFGGTEFDDKWENDSIYINGVTVVEPEEYKVTFVPAPSQVSRVERACYCCSVETVFAPELVCYKCKDIYLKY